MKKLSLFWVFLVLQLIVSACGSGNIPLGGAAGLGDGNGGDNGGGSSSVGDSGGGNQDGRGNGSETGGNGSDLSGKIPSIAQFYLSPTLTTTSTQGNGYTIELSIPPMCQGKYQITAPKTLVVGEQGMVKLIIASNSSDIEKISLADQDTLQVLQSQSEIDMYPNMSAELILGGDSFFMHPGMPDEQFVRQKIPSVWFWYITPQKSGIYKLAITVSVPVNVNGVIKKFTIVPAEEFSINVLESIPPTFTPTLIPPTSILILPTPTPSPSSLTANADSTKTIIGTITGTIIVALITAIGTIIAAFINAKQKDKVIFLQLEQGRKTKEIQRPTLFNEQDLKTMEEERKKRKGKKEGK